MNSPNNLFTLRFFGNQVAPDSFSLKEFGELVISINDGLKEFIEETYPEVNVQDVHISVVGIEHKSESICFKTSGQAQISEALQALAAAINTNTYTNLPPKTFEMIKLIYIIAKGKGCSSELVVASNTLFVVGPDANLMEQADVLSSSVMTVYGTLIQLCPIRGKAWIRLHEGDKIASTLTMEQFGQLQGKLHQPIAVKGVGKWNVVSLKIVTFKITEIGTYCSGRVAAGFEALRSISDGWDNILTDKDLHQHLN